MLYGGDSVLLCTKLTVSGGGQISPFLSCNQSGLYQETLILKDHFPSIIFVQLWSLSGFRWATPYIARKVIDQHMCLEGSSSQSFEDDLRVYNV